MLNLFLFLAELLDNFIQLSRSFFCYIYLLLCVCVCVCVCVYRFPRWYIDIYVPVCVCSITKWQPILYDPMVCNLSVSPVHGIFQVRILKWVAISSSRGSSYFWDLPNPGIEPESPTLQANSLPLCHLGSPYIYLYNMLLWSNSKSGFRKLLDDIEEYLE